MVYRKFLIVPVLLLMGTVGVPEGRGENAVKERLQTAAQEAAELEGGDSAADVSGGESASADDYVRRGLRRNPAVKAAFYRWKTALQRISREFSLPDPVVSYTEYLEPVQTRVGPQERSWSVQQKFPMADKLWLKRAQAVQAADAAYHEFAQQRRDVVYAIRDAYYEYAYLAKAVALTGESMKLLQDIERVLQTTYAAGEAKNQDLLKVQVELGKLENDLLALDDSRRVLVARLNALLNSPPDTVLPWPKVSLEGISEEPYPPQEDLLHRLHAGNYQLRALADMIEEKKTGVTLARREALPDLTVGLTRIDTAAAINPSTPGSGNDALLLMFSVNVPLWRSRINAGISQAESLLQEAEQIKVQKENELNAELSRVHYQLRDALRQSSLYNDALIPKAVQTLDAVQTGYTAGTVDFLSFIDAQRVVLSFQLAYYRHNADFFQRRAELLKLLGEQSDASDRQGGIR